MTAADVGSFKSHSTSNGSAEKTAAPYLKLLYFAPSSALTHDMQLKESMFLFPDDSSVVGSASLFRCILRKMVEKNLVAVARMQRSTISESRLVVLLPSDETTDADGYLEQCGGFYIIQLPFAQETRNVAEKLDENNVDVALHKAAVDLVKGLQFNSLFRYTDLEAPGIQHFYSMLQAIALAEEKCDWDEMTDDMLQPDLESMNANIHYLSAFEKASGLDQEENEDIKPKAVRT